MVFFEMKNQWGQSALKITPPALAGMVPGGISFSHKGVYFHRLRNVTAAAGAGWGLLPFF